MRSVLLAAAALLGMAWQLRQPELLPSATGWAITATGAVGLLALWRWRHHGVALAGLMLAAALLAFGSTELRAGAMLADRLDAARDGQDFLVTGTIAEMPRSGPSGTRFVLDVASATQAGAPVRLPGRLLLGWYRGFDEDGLLGGPQEELRAGQRWRMTVRLRAVHGSANPQGFDLELWAFERGFGASGYVRALNGSLPQKLADDDGHPVERLRQSVRDALQLRVADAGAAGVLAALAIGDQAAIDREGWDLFRVTGVAHLMSISGLHVTMFAWLAGGLAGALWRRHPRLPLRLATPQAARLAGFVAAAGYALVAGWGVPAQRTVWMIGAVVLLRALGLRWPLHAVLLAAALLVAVMDPWALLQPGFWLSFVAVALLAASEPVHEPQPAAPGGWGTRLRAALRGGLRTQLVATVGLTPLSLVFFQQVSVVGFVANLVAIPLVTLLVTPLALLGIVLPPLWPLAAALVQGLVQLLQLLAAWPQATWSAAVAPGWAMAAGLLAGALAVLPLPWRLRALALPLLLPLLAPPPQRLAEGDFELLAADIGQGTAALVRTREHLLVFDTGPVYSLEADAGSRVLLPLLRARGETRIDTLVLSHKDTDHVGGAASLMAALPVGALRHSLPGGHALLAAGPPQAACRAGQTWTWDGVRFDVLHPFDDDDGTAATRPNARSCVLRVQGRGRSALLTADIEAAQEAALVQRFGRTLRSDVMLAPHHGSRTSSTAAFLAAVQPRVTVVQAAWRSRYGHPAPDVMARYAAMGLPVVRSDRCGAWTLQPDGSGLCERQQRRRYWQHRLDPP